MDWKKSVFRGPPEMFERLEQQAEEENRSRNMVVVAAVEEYLARRGK